VVVRLEQGSDVDRDLIADLDRQSLSTGDFEVIWCLSDSESGVPATLAPLVERRPNYKVVAGGLQDALDASSGEYVLGLSSDDRIYPRGLQRLVEFGSEHDLDFVICRIVRPGAPVPEMLWADSTDAETVPEVTRDDRQFVVVPRRTAAAIEPEVGLTSAPGRGGVLASFPLLHRPNGSAASKQSRLPIRNVGWQGSRLVIEVELSDQTGSPTAALLQNRKTLETFILPLTPLPSRADSGVQDDRAARVVSVSFDPQLIPTKHEALSPGIWRFLVQADLEGSRAALHPVAWAACQPALIASTGFVPLESRQAFVIDVGPVVRGLLTLDDPDCGEVRETSVGSLLTINLASLHTHAAQNVEGFLTIGGMKVPAKLVIDDGAARLEAFVSGLQGTEPLGAQFGPGPARPLGLSLEISNVGAMKLVSTPAEAVAEPAKTPITIEKKGTDRRKHRKRRHRRGRLARMRRRVPTRLEPLVRTLARQPRARRLYRRLTH
jgi:hypothetical protein